MTEEEFKAQSKAVAELALALANKCIAHGCTPDAIQQGLISAALSDAVQRMGGEDAAGWLRSLADEIEDMAAIGRA